MLTDDNPTPKRLPVPPVSPAPYGNNGRGDFIERTKLPLPSLSGLDQTPFSPPPDAPTMRTTIPFDDHKREEVTLPNAQIPDPPHANTQTINARKLSSFLLTALLCLISFVAGASIYAYASTSAQGTMPIHELVSSGAHQRSNIPLANVLLGTGSFQVGAQPTFILHGNTGNVTVAAGNAGMITVKTSNKSRGHDANAGNQGINYSRSYDNQRHDVITMTIVPGQIDTTIEVPSSAQVQIEVDSGSISVTGIGGVNIDTNSGNLSINDISKSAHIYTTNGDITAHNVKGQVAMETVNGSIRATTIAGQAKAITQNGDVILREAALNGQSTLKTTYGSVYFSGTIDPRGTYTLDTHSGNVSLALPDNTLLQLHAQTNSGSVYSEFRQNVSGSAAQIIINVGNGSITVRKAV